MICSGSGGIRRESGQSVFVPHSAVSKCQNGIFAAGDGAAENRQHRQGNSEGELFLLDVNGNEIEEPEAQGELRVPRTECHDGIRNLPGGFA